MQNASRIYWLDIFSDQLPKLTLQNYYQAIKICYSVSFSGSVFYKKENEQFLKTFFTRPAFWEIWSCVNYYYSHS